MKTDDRLPGPLHEVSPAEPTAIIRFEVRAEISVIWHFESPGGAPLPPPRNGDSLVGRFPLEIPRILLRLPESPPARSGSVEAEGDRWADMGL